MASKVLNKPDTSLLIPLRESFEKFLEKNITNLGEKNKLRSACEYALLNGGKRIRPLIVMMVAKALDNHLDVMELALSTEYFHTASIIADDLPCMDNDDFRRNKPALHKIHGETVALLASYALISAGYEKIFQGVQVLAKQRHPFNETANKACVIALDAATRCAGISGAVGGQFKDLFPKERSIKEILDVIHKKTVTLFEIAFVFGWIFGGGNFDLLEEVREMASHFGLAFQIADDLRDIDQDDSNSPNIAFFLGREKAYKKFEEEMEMFNRRIKKLGILTPEFQQTIHLLFDYAMLAGSS